MNRCAIVIGATGLVGEKLVTGLGFIYDKVIIIARHPPNAMSTQMKFYQLNDFNNIESIMSSIAIGADTDAFSCLGTTKKQAGSKAAFKEIDFGFNIKFAIACRDKGVAQFFLLSAMGADAKSPVFYNAVKGELEEAIQTLGFRQLVIFRPSLLLGKHKGRPLETIAQNAFKAVAPILPKAFKARPIGADRVAAAMIMTAQDLYERDKFQHGALQGANTRLTRGNKDDDARNVMIVDNKDMLKMTHLSV